VLAIGGGLSWDRWSHGGAEQVRWRDVTAQLGEVRWPRQAGRTFESREELERELRRVQAAGSRLPMIDFSRDRLVLAAAGPRSSSGYAVRVVRVASQRTSRPETTPPDQPADTNRLAERLRRLARLTDEP